MFAAAVSPCRRNLNLKPAASLTAARHGTVTPAARTEPKAPGPAITVTVTPSPQTVDAAPRRLEPSLPAPGLR